MSLEKRLAQHGIASTMTSACKGIFGGQHDEDFMSLTFMDDLAVLVEGDTTESMFSTALQVNKEVCEANALTLNIAAGKTEAIVLIRGDKSKEVKRRLHARVEERPLRVGTTPPSGMSSRLHPHPERGMSGPDAP